MCYVSFFKLTSVNYEICGIILHCVKYLDLQTPALLASQQLGDQSCLTK